MFPTQKPHVSYSEIKTWKECPWRHKLAQIDKVDLSTPSPNLDFGTIVHAELENFLTTRTMNPDNVESEIRRTWAEKKFDELPDAKKNGLVDSWVKWARQILDEVPAFLDENFPNWVAIEAEHALYEDIPGQEIKFKGFIDGLIECDGKRGRVVWVIDWKTSSARGWDSRKRQDFNVLAQIALYKSFWRAKKSMPSKDVKCGYVLLKKGVKPGRSCELFTVSVGPTVEEKARKMVANMIASVKRGLFMKNRESCKYCDYHQTKYCT